MTRLKLFFGMTFCLCMIAFSSMTKAQDVVWKKNFGGTGGDYFSDVIAVDDGYVAVGNSWCTSFGSRGDWFNYNGVDCNLEIVKIDTITGDPILDSLYIKPTTDAIIVKYDKNGNVRWKMHFGGMADDYFTSVTEVPDGYVAVGYSHYVSFGTGDLSKMKLKSTTGESGIIVKFDKKNGTILNRESFGGGAVTKFSSVIAVPGGGIVAVGNVMLSTDPKVNLYDFANVAGRGNTDAFIVKYKDNFSIEWKKIFGGDGIDFFNSVTAVPDGFVAVGAYFGIYFAGGTIKNTSLGNGDWTSDDGVTDNDCFIVKYDNAGNVKWKKAFGGGEPVPRPMNGHQSTETFNSVTTVPDGVIVTGYAESNCFVDTWQVRFLYIDFVWYNSDWRGIAYNGGATMVKFNNTGEVVWKKNFGGKDYHSYLSVTAVPEGVIAIGAESLTGAGAAYLVKHDFDGKEIWKKKFSKAYLSSVTASEGGIAAAGYSWFTSFLTDDWKGVKGNGYDDAVIVSYRNDGDYGGSISGRIKFGDGAPVSVPYNIGAYLIDSVSLATHGFYTYYSAISDESGKYIINGVPQGNYFIRADVVDYYEYPHILSWAYYSSFPSWTIDWRDAKTIILQKNKDISGIDIITTKWAIPNDSSSISGYIGYGTDGANLRSQLEGEIREVEYPVGGVNVFLQQYTSDWSTILSTISNEDGYFGFPNLPAGRYRVVLDIIGLEMLSAVDIELGEAESFDGLEFGITDDGIYTMSNGVTSIMDINKDGDNILLVPNPTTGELRIKSGELKIKDIEIFNIVGKKVFTTSLSNGNTINISHLPAGVYFLKAEGKTAKFIKK